ncbi:MAG: hypothetical protein J6K96_06855 [Treponema sp.]|nr:hypothetical protein [Treponema sp.]
MNCNLTGKKVLLFAPQFFGYETEIANKIKEFGATIDLYDERANPTTFDKICIRLNLRNLLMKKIRFYYETIIEKFEENYFDYVVFLNPETVTIDLLNKLKEKQKKAVFVLYMWDSFENKPHTKELIPFFENKLSFNKDEGAKYGFKFRPLFFIDEYDVDKNPLAKNKTDIDIGFIGTVHSDRYKVLKEVETLATQNGLKTSYYMFFPSKILFYKYKFQNLGKIKISKKDFHFNSLNSHQAKEFLERCKVVIDIQHPKQVGLTMRTIEMLGLRKKLITTNQDIKNYDFYNEDNICVIDRKNILINKNFFDTNYNLHSDLYRKNYSLESFVEEILKQ